VLYGDARVLYYSPYLISITINDKSGNKLYPFPLQKASWFLLVPAYTDEDGADIGISCLLNDLDERRKVFPTIGTPTSKENLNGQRFVVRLQMSYCFGVRLVEDNAGFIPLQPFQKLLRG